MAFAVSKSEGKLGKVGGTVLGLTCVVFGSWGILTGEYSNEGYRWRDGLKVEGLPATVIGTAVLLYGIYILYVVLSHRR